MRLRVLVGCEFSGTVREAFRRRGHDAWSCDLLPAADDSPHHIHGSVLDVLDGWDLAVFHPPCTYLTSAGLHWNKRGAMVDGRPRAELTEEALEFVRLLFAAPIPRIALENPVGCISTRIRPADQIVQPYEFGEDASKKTCFWLKGLPPLAIDPAQRRPGRWEEWPKGSGRMVERWANQTVSGQNRLPPSDDRWALRSLTYPAIAEAMASCWSAPSAPSALTTDAADETQPDLKGAFA